MTATLDGRSTSQVEVVSAPAAPLVLANGSNTVTYALGGAPVARRPCARGERRRGDARSATVAITAGLDAGDVLTATAPGGLAVSYCRRRAHTLRHGAARDLRRGPRERHLHRHDEHRRHAQRALDGQRRRQHRLHGLDDHYTAPPGPPAGVTAAAGNGQAVVTFGAPASDGGTPVTAYTVTASPAGPRRPGRTAPSPSAASRTASPTPSPSRRRTAPVPAPPRPPPTPSSPPQPKAVAVAAAVAVGVGARPRRP